MNGTVNTGNLAERLAEMVEYQNKLNQRLHKKWHLQEWNQPIAILDECMEILTHLGWKWWKVKPDASGNRPVFETLNVDTLQQIRIEVIDIWHFYLSMIYKRFARADDIILSFCDSIVSTFSTAPVEIESERLKSRAIARAVFDLIGNVNPSSAVFHPDSIVPFRLQKVGDRLIELTLVCDITFNDLQEIYLQKACLNRFRWANGYDDGTYVKNLPFGDKRIEDNEFLALVVDVLKLEGKNITGASLMEALCNGYSEATGINAVNPDVVV